MKLRHSTQTADMQHGKVFSERMKQFVLEIILSLLVLIRFIYEIIILSSLINIKEILRLYISFSYLGGKGLYW